MSTFGQGLVILVNGVVDIVGRVLSPVAFCAVVVIAGFAWMARLEVDDMNRDAAKPEIGMH